LFQRYQQLFQEQMMLLLLHLTKTTLTWWSMALNRIEPAGLFWTRSVIWWNMHCKE
jgi:hypothetical protein